MPAVMLFNANIFRSLNKPARNTPTQWDQFLQPVMFGQRDKKQLTTQYSPFLLFGREARYPSEVPEEYEVHCCNCFGVSGHNYFDKLFRI